LEEVLQPCSDEWQATGILDMTAIKEMFEFEGDDFFNKTKIRDLLEVNNLSDKQTYSIKSYSSLLDYGKR